MQGCRELAAAKAGAEESQRQLQSTDIDQVESEDKSGVSERTDVEVLLHSRLRSAEEEIATLKHDLKLAEERSRDYEDVVEDKASILGSLKFLSSRLEEVEAREEMCRLIEARSMDSDDV